MARMAHAYSNDMISFHSIYSNGTNEIDVMRTMYCGTTRVTIQFQIGKKVYYYEKPSFGYARLEKLGYKYVRNI